MFVSRLAVIINIYECDLNFLSAVTELTGLKKNKRHNYFPIAFSTTPLALKPEI